MRRHLPKASHLRRAEARIWIQAVWLWQLYPQPTRRSRAGLEGLCLNWDMTEVQQRAQMLLSFHVEQRVDTQGNPKSHARGDPFSPPSLLKPLLQVGPFLNLASLGVSVGLLPTEHRAHRSRLRVWALRDPPRSAQGRRVSSSLLFLGGSLGVPLWLFYLLFLRLE